MHRLLILVVLNQLFKVTLIRENLFGLRGIFLAIAVDFVESFDSRIQMLIISNRLEWKCLAKAVKDFSAFCHRELVVT
jgi:hypothetical protein